MALYRATVETELNQFASTLFSDINRSMGGIARHTTLQQELNEPATLGGAFRIVRLRKPG